GQGQGLPGRGGPGQLHAPARQAQAGGPGGAHPRPPERGLPGAGRAGREAAHGAGRLPPGRPARRGAQARPVSRAARPSAGPAAPAATQEPKPPTSSSPIHKLTVYNGDVPVVSYTTTSDSPRLQALCRILQWAENEVTLVDQLQRLKFDYLRAERQRLNRPF